MSLNLPCAVRESHPLPLFALSLSPPDAGSFLFCLCPRLLACLALACCGALKPAAPQLLLPQQPFPASPGSKARQTLQRGAQLCCRWGHLPTEGACIPARSGLSSQKLANLPPCWLSLPGERLLRVVEQAKRMAPGL